MSDREDGYNWFAVILLIIMMIWLAFLSAAIGTGLWIFGRYLGVW